MKIKKDKYLGKMVSIRGSNKYPDSFTGRGKVMAKVKQGRKIQYIVQFRSWWSYFTAKQMRVEK